MVTRPRESRRKRRAPTRARGAFILLARGPDGRARRESFGSREAYRSRLAALSASDGPVSLDDVIDLLAEVQPRG